ncbi:hypothetical protein [Peribacillus kribbensis]|uniref:hypothetical protein n=1 Tax=Peribacillus kribbensis TaxID=356658 RepID=UPI0003F72E14|nr:hypothetical protein [Peribacillus kribbensis]
MSIEQMQEHFASILKNVYEDSASEEMTLQEMMKRLEGDLAALMGKQAVTK